MKNRPLTSLFTASRTKLAMAIAGGVMFYAQSSHRVAVTMMPHVIARVAPVQPMGPDTFQRELWRSLQHWSSDPARTRSVWLAYGDSEPFRTPIELMSPLLPPDHVVMLPGHHDWTLWTPAAEALLQRAAATHARRSQ